MLGMVLGSAIMLSLDVSRVILEPVRTARDTIPGYSQVGFLLFLLLIFECASLPFLYMYFPISSLLGFIIILVFKYFIIIYNLFCIQ